MQNDQIYGIIMLLVALAGVVYETAYLIVMPSLNMFSQYAFVGSPVYWALALPIWLAASGVLLIVAWIGYTLFVTPPPESWTFEEEEQEVEQEEKAS